MSLAGCARSEPFEARLAELQERKLWRGGAEAFAADEYHSYLTQLRRAKDALIENEARTPTPDFTGAQDAFTRAQQLVAAQDWPSAIGALDQMRKYDPNDNTSLVDGMYYFALRNYGYDLITKQGNLEGGIYQLTLAERLALWTATRMACGKAPATI